MAIMIVGIKIRNYWLIFLPLSLHVIEKHSKNGFHIALKLILTIKNCDKTFLKIILRLKNC